MNCLFGKLLIVNEPLEAFSFDRDVVGHGLSETPIIGDYKQVDKDDVAHFKAIYHVGYAHVAKSIQNYESGLRIGLYVIFNYIQDSFVLFKFGCRENYDFDWLVIVLRHFKYP